MMITPDCTIAAIATDAPATIRIFQEHEIDFCCGGKVPLKEVCATRGLDLDALLVDLRAAASPAAAEPAWEGASVTALVQHIQARYHEPLRKELPRLDAMLDKVVSRHGTHLPEVLVPLQQTFKQLQLELLAHMVKEDRVLFPFIVALENGGPLPVSDPAWIESPISAMEADHQDAGAALARIRETTSGFAPPDWACPTFRGLYDGLAKFEADMHLHVHIENNILFPQAARLARSQKSM